MGTTGATLLPGTGATDEPAIGIPGSFVENTPLFREVPTNLLLSTCEPIDAEFLVIAKSQLPNHRAQRHLRGFDVHFVEDSFRPS